jgi:hypothetical protein
MRAKSSTNKRIARASNVEALEDGREAGAPREAFELGDVDRGRVVTAEDTESEEGVQGSQVLPNRFSNAVVPSKAKEKLLAEDTGETKGNVAEENVCRLLEGVFAIL